MNIPPCCFWKGKPVEQPTRITDEGLSKPPGDPETARPRAPCFGALKPRTPLGDRARLVTLESGGHGAHLGTGNACGNRAVTTLLLTGERPGQDVSCPDE